MEEELEEKIHKEVVALEDSLSDSEKQIEKAGEAGKVDPFSLFGKIAAIVIIVALLIGGGMYFGQNINKSSNTSVSPTPAVQADTSPSAAPQTQTMPTSAKAAPLDKSTTAGGAKGTSYGVYQVDYPSSWTISEEKTDITDKLTLSKGAYSISIYQAPMGGGGCIYPGDAPSEMAQRFNNFVDIQGSTYKLRRSWGDEDTVTSYTICQSSDGKTWGSPTSYGAISVKVPNPTDPASMAEIDAILASLTTK